MNVSQNSIIIYMTGLSRKSHVSNTRKILKIMSINDLYKYMKLNFVKNLKNTNICNEIFKHLLNIHLIKTTPKVSLKVSYQFVMN
jgi:glutaredoxin-related protein